MPRTCFGILRTLRDDHFVEFVPASKFYRRGAAPARLFQVDTLLNEWTRWLKDELMSLANEFETCQGLWEIAADRETLLEVAESQLQTRIHLRSEEHTSELQSLMHITDAVFSLKKKNNQLASHMR